MKPILFNTDMVKAILEGRKTVTRRVIKFTVQDVYGAACFHGLWYETLNPACPPDHLKEWYVKEVCRPRYQPGDILYVRETWTPLPGTGYMYRASLESQYIWKSMWSPSIHMPREAARLFLRVTGVRVERLQDIDEEGAKAEGTNFRAGIEEKMWRSAVERFAEIWDRTIKRSDRDLYGWAANPWVWVIEFERITKEEATGT